MRFWKTDLKPDVLQEIVRGVMQRYDAEAVNFMVDALLSGRSFDDLERQQNIKGLVMPICRNSFYTKKRLVIQIIQKGGADNGKDRET